MGSKFTEKAEKALNCAVKTAESLGHTYIGSEHIFYSLAEDSLSCSYAILTKCSITKEKIREAIEEYSGSGEKTSLSSKDMTPRCRKIVENSYKISVKYSSAKIGTEHILLALIEERDCVANKLIDYMGQDILTLRDEIVTFLRATDKSVESAKKNNSLQFLNQYGKNLNLLAKNGKIDPVIGRESETERLIRILTRRNKNNPCLIGEAGVGKTAIVEGLARRIVEGRVPEILKNKVIYSVDLTSMVAGAKYRGDFEERIKSIISEASKNDFVILFIDEIHTIVGAGSAEGAIDAANILKPELSRGQIQLIGATTLNEYRKYIEKDPALERRFQPLKVEEATEAVTLNILRELKEKYESHHGVIIDDKALISAVTLSQRYIQDRRLPDKALDLIDEACAKANVKSISNSNKNSNNDIIFRQSAREIEDAVRAGDFKKAEIIHKSTKDHQPEHGQIDLSGKAVFTVTEEDIKEIITEITGIPTLGLSDKEIYSNLEEELNSKVLGQANAVGLLSRAVIRGKFGISDPTKPRGSFLFVGKSGVGKTELAKALSIALFNNDDALIRFDMSEYGEKHSTAKLIGSPPGYVGYDEGGILTEKVRRTPYCVVLFDEIEKASDEVINLMLQIMDDGIITDSSGRRVNFRNSIIIMTSNVGAEGFSGSIGGFVKTKDTEEKRLIEKLRTRFKTEFINRLDEIIPFEPLTRAVLAQIASKRIDELADRLKTLGAELTVPDEVYDYIADKAYAMDLGARPINRIVTNEIENAISSLLLTNEHQRADIQISLSESAKILIEFKEKTLSK